MLESKCDDEIIASALAVLARLFGSIPRLVAHHVTRWHSDPFSFGSYSHIPPFATPNDRTALGERAGALYFAGEATHRQYPATVHGAYQTGIAAAKQLMQ